MTTTKTTARETTKLRTVAPRSWQWEKTQEVAREAAGLIRLSKSHAYTADDWARARGIYNQRERAGRLAVMARAERLAAQHLAGDEFDMIADALSAIDAELLRDAVSA